MKKTTILPWILVFNCFFFAIANGQENPRNDSDTIRNEIRGDYNNSFTLDPMNEGKIPRPVDDTSAVLPRQKDSREIKQYTLSPQGGESVQKHNPNDDIHTLSEGAHHIGGFGGISFKSTQFDNEYVAMAGFKAGLIINRAVAVGFEGYGIIPSAEYEGIDSVYKTRLVGGYGGLVVEPVLFSNTVVHVTFPISGGAGWLGYVYDWEEDGDFKNDDDDDLVDGDVFWYVEPAVAMELNVTKFFRLNIGTSYRFMQDFELLNTDSGAFDGWGYFVTFKFGRF